MRYYLARELAIERRRVPARDFVPRFVVPRLLALRVRDEALLLRLEVAVVRRPPRRLEELEPMLEF